MQATIVESQAAVEALYRALGDRIYRAVWAFSQDSDLASDAVAEAFAQALARGSAIRSPAAWIWRAAFRIAGGMLQQRSRTVSLDRSGSYEMTDPKVLEALGFDHPEEKFAKADVSDEADEPYRSKYIALVNDIKAGVN